MNAQKKVHLEREKAKEMAAKDAEQQDTARKTREAKVKARQDHLDDLDALIDEIDEMLEEQEVLVNFVQKGGQ